MLYLANLSSAFCLICWLFTGLSHEPLCFLDNRSQALPPYRTSWAHPLTQNAALHETAHNPDSMKKKNLIPDVSTTGLYHLTSQIFQSTGNLGKLWSSNQLIRRWHRREIMLLLRFFLAKTMNWLNTLINIIKRPNLSSKWIWASKTYLHQLYWSNLMVSWPWLVDWERTLIFFFFSFFLSFFFWFFGSTEPYGVPRPWIRSELQFWPIVHLGQHGILNPQCQARDWTCVLVLQRCRRSCCATVGMPSLWSLSK